MNASHENMPCETIDITKQHVRSLYRVGDKKAKYLGNLGISTLHDLLHHYPFRYEDRRRIVSIKGAVLGEKVGIRGKVLSYEKSMVKRNKTLVRIRIQDDSAVAELVFFNNPYLLEQLKIGRSITAYGTLEEEYGKLKMVSPELDFDGKCKKIGFIYPIYPLTKGLYNDELILWQREVLGQMRQQKEIDHIPEEVRKEYGLCGLADALEQIHFPKNEASLRIARYRLIFDEFFLLTLGLSVMKNKMEQEAGIRFALKPEVDKLKEQLDFSLTVAQERVLREIWQDMSQEKPMQRLIQGDVGSGKTIVALLSMYNVHCNGYQSVLMAPTEILAKQHFASAGKLFDGKGVQIRLLTGSTPKKEKEAIYLELATGTCHMLIGTHAVIQEKVQFQKLGLVITDEQHRFGVRQRGRLLQGAGISGNLPDMLVMTATPIPRTLAFILHGDLDLSVIDELPGGRSPIITRSAGKSGAAKVYQFAEKEIDQGRQVYIVCPLIEESEKLDIQAATQLYEELQASFFSSRRMALLHGKMKATEKQQIMQAYAAGDLDILVSTTVIEVGINVPNASVMIIQDAQRFGLSQLHQLRGRVGRGEYQSYCMLIYEGKGQTTKERMKILCQSNDGFEISEKDLELRGPGEFLGTRQHGLLAFKLGDITKHTKVFQAAKTLTQDILATDPQLQERKHQKLRQEIVGRFRLGQQSMIH